MFACPSYSIYRISEILLKHPLSFSHPLKHIFGTFQYIIILGKKHTSRGGGAVMAE